MAIFDQSMFNPQSYAGGMSGWLQQALQSGLLGRAIQPQQPPMQPQTGPTYAQGNQGMMGGVPFPIAPDQYAQQQTQLPPGAQPAGPAMPQQTPQLFSGGLVGHLQNALAPLNPAAASIGLNRQIMQAQFSSLMQQPDMTPAKALAIIQNPKLQEQMFGNPTSIGEVKTGTVSIPAYAQGGKVGYAVPGNGGMSSLMNTANEAARTSAAATKLGEGQGTAAAGLPTALDNADRALALIDDIANDKALPASVGMVAGRIPAIGGNQANFVQKVDQLKGQAFLQAWQSLKGAGARITNTEAMRATDAIARLNRVQSEEGFRKALSDLRETIVTVRARAGQLAGGQQTPPPVGQYQQPSGGLPQGWSVQVR